MADENEELDLSLEEEEEEQQVLTPEEKVAQLEATVKALAEKPDKTGEQMAQLIEMGKQFLTAQNAPKPVVTDKKDLDDKVKTFGELLQKTIISGTPEEVGQLFMASVNAASENRAGAIMREYGTPVAANSGKFAVRLFLEGKKDELGSQGEKTHQLVAKDFKLTPDEIAWVATAPPEKASAFLENRYDATAGKLLINSAGRARPKNIASGGGGGAGGGNVINFPGVNQAKMQEYVDLAEQWWPDPKVRAQKLQQVAANLAAEQGA